MRTVIAATLVVAIASAAGAQGWSPNYPGTRYDYNPNSDGSRSYSGYTGYRYAPVRRYERDECVSSGRLAVETRGYWGGMTYTCERR